MGLHGIFRQPILILSLKIGASVAQRLELRFCKPEVVGSNPTASFSGSEIIMDEPSAVVRTCARCKLVKSIDEFFQRKNGRWHSYCRPCHKEWAREYYMQHRAEYIKRSLHYKEKLRAYLRAAKDHPCVDCGRRYPAYVMDFDHREGEQKLFNVAALHSERWVSLRQLQEEIAKCDLVCANCHRERTHQRRQRQRAGQKG